MFDNKNTSKTNISELGEFGLIDHLTQNFKIKHNTTVKGIGDDAAVIASEKDDPNSCYYRYASGRRSF